MPQVEAVGKTEWKEHVINSKRKRIMGIE